MPSLYIKQTPNSAVERNRLWRGDSLLTKQKALLTSVLLSNLACLLLLFAPNGKMRPSPESLSVLPLVIGVVLSPSTVDAAAFRHAGQPAGLIDTANSDDLYRGARGSALPGLTWLRDSISEIIFGRPSTKHSDSTSPSVSLSPYRDDVVVRFNVTKPTDQVVLAQAIKAKHLDVWASTPQFVDIRLEESQLRPLLRLIPSSMQKQWSVLIPDLEEAVRATFPTKGETTEYGDAAESLDAVHTKGNIFFHDYQPLSVSPLACGSMSYVDIETFNSFHKRI